MCGAVLDSVEQLNDIHDHDLVDPDMNPGDWAQLVAFHRDSDRATKQRAVDACQPSRFANGPRQLTFKAKIIW
jgi:hypothetical protein